MKKQPMTDRQQEIYNFSRDHIEDKGWPPSIREIGNHMGIATTNGVTCHLRPMEKKGWIECEPQMARCIRLVGFRLQHVKL